MGAKSEFVDCQECGSGVSIVTNPTECYKCKAKVFSVMPDNFDSDGAPRTDPVTQPAHYTQFDPEPLALCAQLGFLEGNVVKYVCRYKLKNGREDLDKALFYLNRLREQHDENS